MALKDKYFDPKLYYYKIIILCVLICVDIIFNSFTQFLDWGNKSTNYVLDLSINNHNHDLCWGLFAAQLALQMLMIFTLLSIFSQTAYFRQGMLGEICGKFVPTFIFILLYPIVFIGERLVRYLLLMKQKEWLEKEEEEREPKPDDDFVTNISIWEKSNWYYVLLYVLKYIFAFFFYIFSLNTGFELGKVKYYKIESNFGLLY